jgi:hypothetical protein
MRRTLSILLLLLLLLLLSPVLVRAQGGNTITLSASGAPSGTCSFIFRYVDSSTGTEYNCKAGVWNSVGGGGGGGSGTVSSSTIGFTAIYTAATTVGGYLAAGPDVPPASANAMDDEFNGSSLDAKWTGANLGSSTVTEASGLITLNTFTTNAAFLLKSYTQAVPGATPWTMTMKMNLQGNNDSCNKWAGLVLTDNTRYELFGVGIPNNGVWTLLWETMTTASASPTTTGLKTSLIPIGGWYYLRWQNTGTQLIASFSIDGVNFLAVNTENISGGFLGTLTKVGWGADASATTCTQTFSVDWFRRTQ